MSKYGIAGNVHSNMTDQEKVAYSLKLSLSRVTTDAFRTGKEWYTEPDLFLASNKNKILSKNIEKYSDISNYYVVVTDPFTYKKYITNINAEDIVYTHGGYKLDDLCPGGGGNYMVLNIETDEGIRKDYSKEPAEEDFDADGLLKRLPVTSWCFYKYWLNGITGWGGVDENGTYPDKDNIFSAQLTLGSDGNPSGTRIYSNVIDDHTLMAKLKDYIPLELINPNNVPFDLEQEEGISNDLKAKILPHIKINLQVPTVSTAYAVDQVLETELNVDNIAFYNPLLERSLAEVEGYNARGEGNGYWVVGTAFDQNLNFINITPKFGTPIVDQGTMFFSNMSGFLLFFGVPSIIDGDKVSAKCPPMVTAFKYTGETFADGIISQLDAQPDPAVSKDKDLAIWDNTLYRCENGDVSGVLVSIGQKQVQVSHTHPLVHGVEETGFSEDEDLTIGTEVILKSNINKITTLGTSVPSVGQVWTTTFTLNDNTYIPYSDNTVVRQKSNIDALREWFSVGGGGGGVSIKQYERLPPPGLAKDEDLVIDATNTLYSVNIDVADVTVNGWQIGRILQNSNGNTNKASLEIGSDDFYFTMDADIIINHESYKWTEGLFLGSTISVAKINGYVNRFITTIVFVGKGIPGISNGLVPVTQVRTQTKTWQVVGNTIKQETNLDNIENPVVDDLAIKIVNTEGVNDTMWRYTSEKKWEIVGTYIQQVLHLPSTNDAPVVGDLAIKTGDNTMWRYGKNNEGGELWGEVGKNQLQVKMLDPYTNFENDIVNVRWVKDYLQHPESIINATTVKIENVTSTFTSNHNICFTQGYPGQRIIYGDTYLSYNPSNRTLTCKNFEGNVKIKKIDSSFTQPIYLTGSKSQDGHLENYTHSQLTYIPSKETLTCPKFEGALSGNASSSNLIKLNNSGGYHHSFYLGFSFSATGFQNLYTSYKFSVDPSTGTLSATIGDFGSVNVKNDVFSAVNQDLNLVARSNMVFKTGTGAATSYYTKMTLTGAGNLGIGTGSPVCPLHISTTSAVSTAAGAGYWYNGGHGKGYAGAATRSLALKAEGTVWFSGNSGIHVTSDRRVKKNIVEVDDEIALKQLRLIEVMSYDYIDKEYGDGTTIGFISQQVKEILPMAVQIQGDYLPDEMREVEVIFDLFETENEEGETIIKYKFSIDDLLGAKYRFKMLNGDKIKSVELEKGEDGKFTCDTKYDGVYIYGKWVDDFHILSKAKLFTVNFSATQQIDKNQIILQQKVDNLENELALLKAQVEILILKV
jgi:hypothetical protein